jgi:hypothetical protein
VVVILMIAALATMQAGKPWEKYQQADEALRLETWVTRGEAATGEQFSIRIKDLNNKVDYTPKVWIAGNYQAVKTIPYRRDKRLYRFDCRNETMQLLSFTAWKADGSVHSSWDGSSFATNVVPGTLAELWLRAVCPH